MQNKPHGPVVILLKLAFAASYLLAAPAAGAAGDSVTTGNTGNERAIMSPALKELVDFHCDKAILLTVPQLVRTAALPMSEPANRIRLARYFVLIGRAFMFDDNETAAAQALSIARQLDPENLLAASYLAESLTKLGRHKESDAIYTSLEPLAASQPAAAKAMAKRAEHTADFATGKRLLQVAIEADPTDNSSRVALAAFLKNNGLSERAAAIYRVAAQYDLSKYNRELFLALADAITGKPESAIKHYRQAGAILPNEPTWHTNMAFVLIDHGGNDAALKQFSQATQCRRFSTLSFTILAEFLSFIDRKQDALKCLDYVDHFRPWSALLHMARGDVYFRGKEPAKAEAEFKKALAVNPRGPWIYAHLANLYSQEKRHDLVLRTMMQAVRNIPNSSYSWRALADAQLHQGQTDDAINSYQKALTLYDAPTTVLEPEGKADLAYLHACLGTACFKANRTEAAIEQASLFNHFKPLPKPIKYLSWVRRRPDRLNFKQPAADTAIGKAVRHAALADVLYETDNLDDCCAEYRKAIEQDPSNIEWNMCLLAALIDKKDYGQAIKEDFILTNKLMGKAPQIMRGAKDSTSTPQAAPTRKQ